MLDKTQFAKTFALLAARFGKDFGDQAGPLSAGYFTYLDACGLSDVDLERAARAIFATHKFFPRPADFLCAHLASEWAVVLDALDACRPPDYGWAPYFKILSGKGRNACLALGGIPTMREIADKDLVRLKQAWERAYEQATEQQAMALPSAAERKALTGQSAS